ncbi:uncharacterized protein ACRADG_001844 [Cochliomyia hominivorax]
MDKSAKPIFKRKKWADTEIQKLLKYLLEQQEFEKPTAQVFYRTFLATCDIDATWDIIRWKVRYLKTTYIKAESWRRTTEAKLLETNEGASVLQDTLRKRCRFYDELHRIFGDKISDVTFDETTNSSMELNSTENTYESEQEFCGFKVTDMTFSTPDIHIKAEPLQQENEYDDYEIIDPETVIIDTNIQTKTKANTKSKTSKSNNSPDIPAAVQNDRNPLKRRLECEKSPQTDESYSTPNTHNKSQTPAQEDDYDEYEIIEPDMELIDKNKNATTSNKSLDLLSVAQSERNSLLKQKLDFEREKFKMEFELKRRKFEEEINDRKEKLELKKLEMEMKERLRILELEKQERIETLEIEMRYKYGNRKIE